MHKTHLKKIDISLDEALDNEKIENKQILNKTFDIIDERIDVIIDNNVKILDNQLKMESKEKKFNINIIKWNWNNNLIILKYIEIKFILIIVK